MNFNYEFEIIFFSIKIVIISKDIELDSSNWIAPKSILIQDVN